ncbi:hypothetical protein DE146DRAFT_628015 [Phaeosphaeria sp. MPI-PUGE-AT-0046c]|nr:hypothetical protein DE146DRAFT_628015 [Phaeosphaeria sp. MPI-PUGE-AT-0046c]
MEPSTPSTPPHDSDPPVLFASTPSDDGKSKDEEPLYTEINIPLPFLPSPPNSLAHTTTTSATTHTPPSKSNTTTKSHSRTRARSLSSFSFRSRSSSTSSSSSPPPRHSTDEPWPRIRPSLLRSRETAAAMDLGHASKRGRSGTVDALAVVPAVLVLSAELFTPGTGGDGKRGGRRGLVEGMR